MASDFFKKLVKITLGQIFKEGLRNIFSPPKKEQPPESNTPKSHPWRLCPLGEHWVRTHPLTIPTSKKMTTRHGHCRKNTGRTEFYSADELREIAHQHFHVIKNDPDIMPTANALTKFPNSDKYDELIGGWTKFWNETLKPKNTVTPDLIKALIATESSFELPDDVKSKAGPARGLIQITESTRKILQDPKGELKNHRISMTIEESREPEINIGAGIRWLHHKKYLAEHRLKREITWEEAVAEYKGITKFLGKDELSDGIMIKLREYHKILQEHRGQIK